MIIALKYVLVLSTARFLEQVTEIQDSKVVFLPLPLTSCMIYGKLLKSSFLILSKMG